MPKLKSQNSKLDWTDAKDNTKDGSDDVPLTYDLQIDTASNGGSLDPTELREWLDSYDYVVNSGGSSKAAELLRHVRRHAER